MMSRGNTQRMWLARLLLCVGTCSCTAAKVDSPAEVSKRVAELARECRKQHPRVPWILLREYLARSKKEQWVVVDVRSKLERDVSVIPGAVAREAFEKQLASHRKKPILVYCTVGCRSGAYAGELRKKGLDAYNLGGGVLAWALNGRTFVTPDGKTTRRVHVYARKWNVLPPGYVGVTRDP